MEDFERGNWEGDFVIVTLIDTEEVRCTLAKSGLVNSDSPLRSYVLDSDHLICCDAVYCDQKVLSCLVLLPEECGVHLFIGAVQLAVIIDLMTLITFHELAQPQSGKLA